MSCIGFWRQIATYRCHTNETHCNDLLTFSATSNATRHTCCVGLYACRAYATSMTSVCPSFCSSVTLVDCDDVKQVVEIDTWQDWSMSWLPACLNLPGSTRIVISMWSRILWAEKDQRDVWEMWILHSGGSNLTTILINLNPNLWSGVWKNVEFCTSAASDGLRVALSQHLLSLLPSLCGKKWARRDPSRLALKSCWSADSGVQRRWLTTEPITRRSLPLSRLCAIASDWAQTRCIFLCRKVTLI